MRIPFTSRAPLAQGAGLAACGRVLALMLALVLAGCGGKDATESAADAGTDETQAGVDTASGGSTDAQAGAGADSRIGVPSPPDAVLTPPPPPEAPQPPQPLPGTDAVIVAQQSGPAAAAPDFDARAFAGTYSAGTTRLDIGADGQFALDESGQVLTGTWTLQAGGKTIVLDPDAKGDTDRLLQLEPDGSVRIAGGATLRRQ